MIESTIVQHYLIVYDRKACRLISMRVFPDDQRRLAGEERLKLELEHRLNPDMEIIVVSSTSREVLEVTHSRYFKTVGELLRDGEKLTYKR